MREGGSQAAGAELTRDVRHRRQPGAAVRAQKQPLDQPIARLTTIR